MSVPMLLDRREAADYLRFAIWLAALFDPGARVLGSDVAARLSQSKVDRNRKTAADA